MSIKFSVNLNCAFSLFNSEQLSNNKIIANNNINIPLVKKYVYLIFRISLNDIFNRNVKRLSDKYRNFLY